MNSILMTFMLMSFLIMLFSTHPMTLGSMVMFQCIITASMLTKSFNFSWFSFFIFIIYLGGILMLFSYIISLTFSKEPMMKSINKNLFMILLGIVFVLMFFNNKETTMEFTKMKFHNLIFSCFSSSMKISILLMVFLLIVMMMVVFMTESSKGNMRIM